MMSAKLGHAAIVKLLLSYGGNASIPDASGALPLEIARLNGHRSVEELLIDPELYKNAVSSPSPINEQQAPVTAAVDGVPEEERDPLRFTAELPSTIEGEEEEEEEEEEEGEEPAAETEEADPSAVHHQQSGGDEAANQHYFRFTMYQGGEATAAAPIEGEEQYSGSNAQEGTGSAQGIANAQQVEGYADDDRKGGGEEAEMTEGISTLALGNPSG